MATKEDTSYRLTSQDLIGLNTVDAVSLLDEFLAELSAVDDLNLSLDASYTAIPSDYFLN